MLNEEGSIISVNDDKVSVNEASSLEVRTSLSTKFFFFFSK